MRKLNQFTRIGLVIAVLVVVIIVWQLAHRYSSQHRIAMQRIVYCVSPAFNMKPVVHVGKLVNNGDSYQLIDVKQLTDGQIDCRHPRFSPDGKAIIYEATTGKYENRQTNIYRMDADGGNQRCITPNAGSNIGPAFSFDGKRIVFASNRDSKINYGANFKDEFGFSIYTMNTDGSNAKRLTHTDSEAYTPSFSPDGKLIAYISQVGRNAKLFVMNADGSGQRQLLPEKKGDFALPVFSPDGKQIFCVSSPEFVPGQDTAGLTNSIFVVDVDGSGHKQLPLQTNGGITLGPYGDCLLYYNNNDRNTYSATLDGNRQSKTPIKAASFSRIGFDLSCFPYPDAKVH